MLDGFMNDSLYKLSVRELRARAQSTAPEAGRNPFLGLTIRFVSIYITKYVLLRTAVTPNWVTVISVLVFFTGISLYFFDSLPLQLLGSFLIWFSVVLDGCDGEMARLRGNPSGVGSLYTEPVSHDIMYALMFFPIALNLYFNDFPSWILIIGWIASTGKLLQRIMLTRFDKVLEIKSGGQKQSDGEGDPVTGFNPNVSFLHKVYRFMNRNFFSSVGLVIPLTLSALVGHLEYFLYVFALFFTTIPLLHFYRQTRAITVFSQKNIVQDKKEILTK